MSAASNGVRITLIAVVMALMASCHQRPQEADEPMEPIAQEGVDMRTAVPLVRPLDATDAARSIELEFDVISQPDDDKPPLFIGVRVAGDDPTEVADVADRLVRSGISAEVHLYRLEESGLAPVGLGYVRRSGPTEVEFVALAPAGEVPGLSDADADIGSMESAGLLATGAVYREMRFTVASDVPAGRYKAVVRLGQNHQALLDANAELLIAYMRKGK